jgi:hypothetical protein
MNRRSLSLSLLVFAAVLFIAPRSFAAPVVLIEDETIKLPCGHAIKVLSVSKVEFSKGVPALMVRYQTPLSVDEAKALSQEVDDVWKIAVKDVEHYVFREAIISSNEEPKGIFISANHMLNFLYEKGSDGKWTRLNRSDILAER